MMSAGKIVALASAVMVIGLVGGAAVAAPEAVVPIAKSALTTAIERSTTAFAESSTMLAQASANVVAIVDSAAPRTLAMMIVGALAAVLALAALVTSWRARRARAVAAPRSVPFSSSTPVNPRRSTGRNARPTPGQVHALAAQGKSLADIARGTGLPVDAIALMIAVADPARQLPHTTA